MTSQTPPESIAPPGSGGRKAWIRWLVLAVLTAAIFYFISTRLDFTKVGDTLKRANFGLVLLAFAVTALFPVLSALRWRRMLLALGYEVSFRDCFAMIMAAWPMGTITPSKTGDFVKAYYLKDRVPVGLVLGSVLAERLLDVLVLLGLALLGCVLFGRWSLAAVAALGLVGSLLTILALLKLRLPIPEKIASKIKGVLTALQLLARSPALLLTVIGYTVLNWFASIVQMVLCYQALGASVPILFTMGALPLAIFVGLLPVTLSGMGTRDLAIIELFAAHASPEISLGAGLLYSLYGYWIPAVIGLPFMKKVLPR